MPVERATCDSTKLSADDFGRQVLRDGDVAVNIRTGKLFKSIVKGIYQDVKSAFNTDVQQDAASSGPSRSSGGQGRVARTRR